MKSIPNTAMSRAKISTMPRTKTDASSQLDLYKMVTERQRIQRELLSLKERTAVLQKRLDLLNSQIESTEQSIYVSRQPRLSSRILAKLNTHNDIPSYSTFEIEY